ncbi:hypothetical protein ICM_05957 [Bacillus cereus BAG1X2-3]|uniref:ABC transporter ATP-binding protein n=1 Tax=Bacillus cereus TaxID=1396 RepID=A0A9X7HNJ4_BACCE|nr:MULTISPECIES: ABC transporter ATP-binding protein [Bacillus cereus group]EOO25055.1 hypothetical protein ICC_04976 [Bacillus cereus BAG1X1-1]EOO44054.1 hypothetical protein ICI_05485 [Bacillus cereus BAG1X2-1]EOO46196.1 hypothetical protein ICK_05538 [Bacillus cereus BAG1X2-2]EOO62643.1 hypothetical protein ICM_05957 [Bacillus cereus BAG1X2-3]EOP01551.1 hypothetical protein ICO_05371 [Bacillus cereus BAG2O-1]
MSVYKRILNPLIHEKILLTLSIFAGFFAAVLNLSRPILLGLIVGELVAKRQNKLILLVSLYALSWVMTWVINIILQYLCTKVSQKILMTLRGQVLGHFLELPLSEIEKVKQGRIEALTTSDLPAWTNLYGSTLAEIIHSLSQFIGAVIALNHLNTELTIFIIPFLVLSTIIPILMSKKIRNVSRDVQDSTSNALEHLSGIIQGVLDLISFKAQAWGLKRYKKAATEAYKNEIKRTIYQSFLQISGSISEVAAYILVLSVGVTQVFEQKMEVGELVAFLATIEMLFFPVRYAGNLLGSIQYSIAAASRVWEFFDLPKQKKEKIHNDKISLSSVYFGYPNEPKDTLKNINLSINPGELVVIVGESGSGKSSLLKLLAGLYQPSTGSIQYEKAESKVSIAWQDPFLYDSTLIENLCFDNKIPLNVIQEKSELVNVHSIVEKLSEGYEEKVKNNGGNFSGGERKRISLLRALVQNPNVLILDEPTSGLDPKNQQKVWEMIANLDRSVTRIVSTHDIDKINRADKIIVLSKGEIIECGTPNELISKKGVFHKMLQKKADKLIESYRVKV